jgi:urease subunit alpha
MFGAFGRALIESAVTFVSRTALQHDLVDQLHLQRPLVAVEGCRSVDKRAMALNDALPKIEVDPETYEVRADGELLTCPPAKELALAQRYFLF